MNKIEILENARIELKKEFVGLDSIIDKIILSVTPWYVTPEIIRRPTIVSLWGMTGTGKTSVVNRLLELLDLKRTSLSIDCGKTEDTIGNKISDLFNIEGIEVNPDSMLSNLVFVLDEFQYARTIDESGSEYEDKSGVRPIWSLLDTGILDLNERNYNSSTFLSFVEDFLGFAQDNKDMIIKDGKIVEEKDVKKILEALGYFYYDRGIPGFIECPKDEWELNEDGNSQAATKEDKSNPFRPVNIIEKQILRIILNRMKALGIKKKTIEYIQEINSIKTVGEMADYLVELRKIFTTPRYMNCGKSLIFVLGNLDEAFTSSTDLTPDIDADIFYQETQDVSISDIKNALLRRFKPEQVARIGNNIIKYPSLKRTDFLEVIRRELEKSCLDFEKTTGIKVNITKNIIDLVYSEGVYPVQGVRPIFTTIGTLFTPVFSDIIRNGLKGPVEIDIKEPELGWSRDKVTLIYGGLEKEIELELGKLRNPGNRKLRYAYAVHEAGHAVVSSYLTGDIPSAIISVDTQKGGVTVFTGGDLFGEIDSREDLETDVCVSLAGYYSEEIIFGKPSKILLGSGSDINSAWSRLSEAVFMLGYFEPISLANMDVEFNGSGISSGIDFRKNYEKATEILYRRLEKKTKLIINDNIDLIRNVALDLAQTGKMLGPDFQKYIDENKTGTLNSARLKEAKEDSDYRFYERKLRGEI